MSMHNDSVASFERINKSFASDGDEEDVKRESKRKCVIITCVVIALAAAILALILVLVLRGSSGSVENGYNSYSIAAEDLQDWYYESILTRTKDTKMPVPFDNVTNPEFDHLRMRVSMMNDHTYRLRINPVELIEDSNNGTYKDIKRWEVPQSVITDLKEDYSMRLKWGGFQSSSKNPGIQLSNPSGSGVNYLSTKNRNFVFSDKYLEMGFLVDSQHIYGFGERHRHFELRPGNYTAWTDGRDNLNDQGKLGYNLYSDHPFVLIRLKDNTFVGIFFKNSNAKTLEYKRVSKGQSILNFRAIGGILDFYTFVGDRPEDVIQAYHKLIGSPYFPPFWALGFHQGSLQYASVDNLNEVIDGYNKAEIPLESIWLDMKYMDNYQNFIVDKVNFPKLTGFSDKIHKDNQKVVTVIQSGLKADEGYTYYKQASSQKKLIKSTQNPGLFNGDLIGEGPMGKCAYIDFSHNNITEFWVNALRGLYTDTLFDALWLDWNEVQSTCSGECPFTTYQKRSSIDLPFDPTGQGEIENRTLSLDAQHFYANPEDKALNVEFNLHSLYGTLQSQKTYSFWFNSTSLKGKRPFIVSRSTFAGAGRYASHWLGPNNATWADMQLTVSGIMSFGMYGIPLTGATVCGYNGGFDEELCARWYQLSAFYPFARNHYGVSDKDHELLPQQEGFRLNAPYDKTAKKAVEQRYSFLRYIYTRLFEISKFGGGSLIRPLFFEFPKDENTYLGYEHSFMVGDAIKVTPQLRPEEISKGHVSSYFPKNSRFISLNDFTTISLGGDSGLNRTILDSFEYTIVHLKEGKIIPYQNTTDHYFGRTYNLINDRGLDIVIFPDLNGYAEGTIYIDKDGDSELSYESGAYEYYKLRYSDNTLKISLIDGTGTGGNLESGNHIIKSVYILGVDTFDLKEPAACAFSTHLEPEEILVFYDAEKKIVKMNITNSNTLTFHEIAAIQFYPNSSTAQNFCKPKYFVTGVSTQKSENGDNVVSMKVNVNSSANLPSVEFQFILVKDSLVRIKAKSSDNPNAFEVTDQVFNPELLPLDGHLALNDITDYVSVPNQDEEFFFEIHAYKDKRTVLYTTRDQSMIITKYFTKIASLINSNGRIFGLGERVGDLLLTEGIYTIWARDEPSPVENGRRPGNNMYGAFPVYFSQLKSGGNFFAVLDNNAGAQDYIIEKNDKGMRITHVQTSGVTDMFVLMQDSIQGLIPSFIDLVGRPALVPEWSLGWHQCRWGYNNSVDVENVVEGYRKNNIPLDAIWTDIDYMDQYRDFTISEKNFGDLATKVAKWQDEYDIHYVPILDAAIAYEPNNAKSAYASGHKKGIFIKDPNNPKKPFIGKVWPGEAVYIDWLHPDAEKWWSDQVYDFYYKLGFDGVWIDMNEASNFCNGHCLSENQVADSVQNKLFWVPGARDLNTKSISIDAMHVSNVTEFEAHSLYGFYMTKASNQFFQTLKKRPFIISRSTFSGVGKFGAKWLGDNFSTFEMMKRSVNGIYLFNMFGVPFVGADICGFIGNTNPGLCARWYALGIFYPFARNHNDQNSIAQEPFVDMFSKTKVPGYDTTITDVIRMMSWKRYALHRYAYSNLHMASYEGVPYFKPLFFNYPDEDLAFVDTEKNILLGDSIKISPVFQEVGVDSFYFPGKGEIWCPIWPETNRECFAGQSTQKNVAVPLFEVLAHIRSGSIIPLQLGDLKAVEENMNLSKLKNIPIDLGILVDTKYTATGFVRYDGGETTEIHNFTEFHFSAKGVSSTFGTPYLNITIMTSRDDSIDKTSGNQDLNSVVIYNSQVFKLSANSVAVVEMKDKTTIKLNAEFDQYNKLCRFSKGDASKIELRNVEKINISAK